MQRLEDSIGEEEDYSLEAEESEAEEDLSDDSCGSESMGVWDLLPDVCLRHVFRFLPDRDRASAALVCHHWHNVMRSPSLWRYRSFHFSGRISKFKQSEYCSAITYVRHLGCYLERLQVTVSPPRRTLLAQRLEQVITALLYELISVRAPLRSLAIVDLALDHRSWTSSLRASVVNSLTHFLQRSSSKLTSVSLNGMRLCFHQGMELLSELLRHERRFHPWCYIYFLDLESFFCASVNIHLNPYLPKVLSRLQCLTHLRLSYSCLSDELLLALHQRCAAVRQNTRENGNRLKTFSLHCFLNETHEQVVFGSSWATLASSCPDLKVKLSVDQIINTNRLARILQPEIPLSKYHMTALYSLEAEWSPRPLLSDILPQYRHSLEHLSLDLTNYTESLDEELLELVKMCERLVRLGIWAFLEIRTVGRLLNIRLTQRSSLNKIKVGIYTMTEDTREQEEELVDLLLSYLHLPPELEFAAKFYHFE